jgi:hypothetical protein
MLTSCFCSPCARRLPQGWREMAPATREDGRARRSCTRNYLARAAEVREWSTQGSDLDRYIKALWIAISSQRDKLQLLGISGYFITRMLHLPNLVHNVNRICECKWPYRPNLVSTFANQNLVVRSSPPVSAGHTAEQLDSQRTYSVLRCVNQNESS